MYSTHLLVLLAAIVAIAFAQTGSKLEGHWRRAACSCAAPRPLGDCNDIWLTDYPKVIYNGGAWTGADTTQPPPPVLKNLVFDNGVGPEFILTVPVLLGYDCHGALGKEMICENAARDTEYCRVTWECVDGDCATTLATQNMRSIMYPIVGAILALVWLALSFIKGLPMALIAMILAIVIFVLCLFLLVAPLVYPALMAMAFAAIAFSANKSEGKWEMKLAIIAGIFVFLAFAGLNGLAGSIGSTNFFDATMSGFSSETCFRAFGLDLKSPRCSQYLLFTGFLGFVIMMLVPLLVIVLLARLGDEKK